MSSPRLVESMETDDAGRVISRSRLGWGGSWAQAGATKKAPASSMAILLTGFIVSQILSFPRCEVHWSPFGGGCEGRFFSLCLARLRAARAGQHQQARHSA